MRVTLTAFSRRSTDIASELDRTGRTSPAATDTATLITRPAKPAAVNLNVLRGEWERRAERAGVTPDKIADLARTWREPSVGRTTQVDRLLGPGGLTAHTTTFDRRTVLMT